MVKAAGFWKRMKNGLKKLTEGVAKGIKKAAPFLKTFSNVADKVVDFAKPALNLIPYGNIIGEVADKVTDFAPGVIDGASWVADKAYDWATDGGTSSGGRTLKIQQKPYDKGFDLNKVQPGFNMKQLQHKFGPDADTRAYFRSRGEVRPKYYYN